MFIILLLGGYFLTLHPDLHRVIAGEAGCELVREVLSRSCPGLLAPDGLEGDLLQPGVGVLDGADLEM